MSYQLITHHNAEAFTIGREGHSIRFIVIHHWDDPARHPTFAGVIAWFKNPSANTSAHYVVEGGRVACLVDESDTAYHAGNWTMNLESIGIECNPRCSQEDLHTVRELVADLKKRYPGAQVIGHQDVISTGCPGRYYAHLDYLRAARPAAPARRKIAVDGAWGGDTTELFQTVAGTPVDRVISGQYSGNRHLFPGVVSSWEWSDDPQGSQAIARLQTALGIEPDGIAGADTNYHWQIKLGVTPDKYFGYESVSAAQRALNQGRFW